MSATTASTDTRPWYRQFWPWFIIALPASTVVACMVTIWLALANPETIVRAELPEGSAWQPQSEVRSAYQQASPQAKPARVAAGAADEGVAMESAPGAGAATDER